MDLRSDECLALTMVVDAVDPPQATSERRIRLRAMRCDSTVVEADVKYPTHIGLVGNSVRVLVHTGKKLAAQRPEVTTKVRVGARRHPGVVDRPCGHARRYRHPPPSLYVRVLATRDTRT